MTHAKPTPEELEMWARRLVSAKFAFSEDHYYAKKVRAVAQDYLDRLQPSPPAVAVDRDGVLTEIGQIIIGKRLIGNPIGPLYGVGWNAAIDYIVKSIEGLKSSPNAEKE